MYKLRIYKISGCEKGNIDHEEFFNTLEELNTRYKELFKRELYGYNPTAWEQTNNEEWGQEWERLLNY